MDVDVKQYPPFSESEGKVLSQYEHPNTFEKTWIKNETVFGQTVICPHENPFSLLPVPERKNKTIFDDVWESP